MNNDFRTTSKIHHVYERLGLYDMTRLLEKTRYENTSPIKVLRDFLSSQTSELAFFNKDLCDFLDILRKTRNDTEYDEVEFNDTIHSIRKQVLGIGRWGYLLRLLEIKKSMKNK
jgi:hypothetical protein